MIVKLLVWFTASICVLGAGYLGTAVPFNEQWPLYEALRTTAAIIFAVVGAWFAIIYPERLRTSFRGTEQNASSASDRGIQKLFTPIVHSTFILSAILLLGVVAPLAKRSEWMAQYVEVWRGVSFGILVALTLWQLVTVLYSLIGPDILKTQVDHEENQDAIFNDFTKLQRKHSDKTGQR